MNQKHKDLELSNRLAFGYCGCVELTMQPHRISLNNMRYIMDNRLAVRDYHHHKRMWWKTFRMYQLMFLHLLGTTIVIISFIGMIDTIKYFLGY